MIRYRLECEIGDCDGHRGFEAWFRDSAAYEAQAASGHVMCPYCGGAKVRKALMTPSVGAREAGPELAQTARKRAELMGKMAALRAHIEANTDDVGREFPDEARRIHHGETEHRAIRGEATPDEAKALHDEGVPVAPLPPVKATEN